MIEIEQKYRISDQGAIERQLLDLGATGRTKQHHIDTYFQHPCRDFAQTGEAFRIRLIDGQPLITYKGPKDPGPVKIREELEWSLAPGDADGSNTKKLLDRMGFQVLAKVEKTRRCFELFEGPLIATIDEVKNVGIFTEIEAIVADRDDVAAATSAVLELAQRLGMRTLEPKSYLSLVLESSK